MNIKSAIITCLVVVLYLSICSWRVERLDEEQGEHQNNFVLNVK